jgi:4a-hydroxytetrahydrobiopterin dehydratase
MKPIETDELTIWLAKHDTWQGDQNGISTTWKFKDFSAAIAFMQDAVEMIESHNHHPEWTNVYNRLSVTLTTHDAGNRVTALDLTVATELEARYRALA